MKKETSKQAAQHILPQANVTSHSSCKCSEIECARTNGLGQYVCGICDKNLDKVQSNEFAKSRASYYGY